MGERFEARGAAIATWASSKPSSTVGPKDDIQIRGSWSDMHVIENAHSADMDKKFDNGVIQTSTLLRMTARVSNVDEDINR